MASEGRHPCANPDCDQSCHIDHLLCGVCWSRVPKNLQGRVYSTYRRLIQDWGNPGRRDDYQLARRRALASLQAGAGSSPAQPTTSPVPGGATST